MNPEILHQFDQKQVIPSAPHIVSRLLEITSDPNYRNEDVVKLLSTDAGIASDVLRLANSALLSAGRKIASVSEAIVRLGIRQVRMLVVSRGMIDAVNARKIRTIDMSYFWRRSLATGVLASRIAEEVTRVSRDHAFTAGLLCDVGVLVLAQALPDKYAKVAELYAPRHGDDMVLQEIEHFGGSHADVSAVALERWSLPAELIAAVRYHHTTKMPADAPEHVTRLARILNGAGEIARFLCESRSKAVVRSMCLWAIETIGIKPQALQKVIKSVEADIEELAKPLRIDVVPSKVYSLLADALSEQLVEVGS